MKPTLRKEMPSVKRVLENTKYRKEQWAGRYKGNPAIAKAILDANVSLPNTSVKEKLTVGSHEEVTFHVTGGHSSGSAYVYSPSERVLCTGDNLLTCYAQLFGKGETMLDTYRHWETLDIDYVIPGHGEVVTKEYITKVRSCFDELISTLKELEDTRLDCRCILQHPKLSTYFGSNHANWIEGSQYHRGWLNNSIIYWCKKLTQQKWSRDVCTLLQNRARGSNPDQPTIRIR